MDIGQQVKEIEVVEEITPEMIKVGATLFMELRHARRACADDSAKAIYHAMKAAR